MFITVLEEFIRQKGITSAKMLSDLDMNKSSVLNWKTRGTMITSISLSQSAVNHDHGYIISQFISKVNAKTSIILNLYDCTITAFEIC